MNDMERKAQQIHDANRALIESNASHNLRAALAAEQMRCKCWRVAAIVAWIVIAAWVAASVLN